jgi:hypothetical protein
MKRAITVAGELERRTKIVLTRWPRWGNVLAAVVLAAGVAAPAVPGASGVVNGLAANALRAVLAADARPPPRALNRVSRIASEVIPIPGIRLGEDTSGVDGEPGVVARGGAVIGGTAGALGAWAGVAVGLGVGVESGPWWFWWPGGAPP